MAELFQRDRSTIQRHVKRIYEEGELKPDLTCAFFAQVQTEGKRQVERQIPIYNLDMIISVGVSCQFASGSSIPAVDNSGAEGVYE